MREAEGGRRMKGIKRSRGGGSGDGSSKEKAATMNSEHGRRTLSAARDGISVLCVAQGRGMRERFESNNDESVWQFRALDSNRRHPGGMAFLQSVTGLPNTFFNYKKLHRR